MSNKRMAQLIAVDLQASGFKCKVREDTEKSGVFLVDVAKVKEYTKKNQPLGYLRIEDGKVNSTGMNAMRVNVESIVKFTISNG